MGSNKRIAFVVNVDWFFISHRLPLAIEARKRGWEVYVVTKDTGHFDKLRELGLNVVNLEVDRSGKNLIKELAVIFSLVKILKTIKPDVVHNVTMKIALYASIASRFTRTDKMVNAISGLGFNFTSERKSITQKIILSLMSLAFKGKGFSFIFQNPDDANMFAELKLDKGNSVTIIKGSGVDLDEYKFEELPVNEKVIFVLTARMLKDKGVGEFVEAAQIIESKYPNIAEFFLVGGIDPNNPAGYTKEELEGLIRNTSVFYKGFSNDVKSVLVNSTVVVLPSYREGLPKSLIEACAVGRPIITTDAVGCRESVDNGFNGYLVPIGDAASLAKAMQDLISDSSKRKEFGLNSREKAEKEFSIDSVVEKTFEIYAC